MKKKCWKSGHTSRCWCSLCCVALFFRTWLHRLFTWSSQSQHNARLHPRGDLLHCLRGLLPRCYRWIVRLHTWLSVQLHVQCKFLLYSVLFTFLWCVCMCRGYGRLQHELRPSAAWTQHPCGNTGSRLHLVGWQSNTHTHTQLPNVVKYIKTL